MDAVLAATQADLFWLPDSVQRLDRPDVLALFDGSSKDLHNQVVRVRSSEGALPALVAEIDRWHTGVSQWLVVPPNQGTSLERLLPGFGYVPRFNGHAYTVATDRTFSEADVEVCEVTDLATLEDNVRMCSGAFGRDVGPYDAARELALCTGPSRRTVRHAAR